MAGEAVLASLQGVRVSALNIISVGDGLETIWMLEETVGDIADDYR